jgi:alkyl hydroperoxide reductase subunit F
MIYDLIIIGGGPAGSAAAVYAARKRLKTLLVTYDFGGQSIVSEDIQNWVGTPHISGMALAESFKTHVETYKENVVDIKEGEKVISIKKNADNFDVATDADATYQSRAVLIATGSGRRKLEAPGADRLEHKGLTYCASCDGPIFAGQPVAVIGGGNAAFETAAQLLAYCETVTLLNRGGEFRADPITVEKVLKNPKMKAIANAEIMEIKGERLVEGLTYKDGNTGRKEELKASGIFVEIGQIPNTDFAKGLLELDKYNRIAIDPWTQKTSVSGVWAAGDSTNIKYHQNNIAAGDAVRAIEDIYVTLHAK